MNEKPTTNSEKTPFVLDIDLRPVDTRYAIFAMRRYLELMEQQMPVVQASAVASLEAERPPGDDEEEQSIFNNDLNNFEQLFEEDLLPTMRYSLIVFLHTVLETRLSAFCDAMQRERGLPIGVSEVRGRGIEQAQLYLSKLAGIAVGDFDEWKHLRAFQVVRNCIVHSYGYIEPEDSRSKQLHELAGKQVGLSITHHGRIALDATFCQQHLAHISSLFQRLFVAAGWKP